VRAGDMAALPLLKRFGVTEAVRASAYLYNSVDEIDRFVDALEDLTDARSRMPDPCSPIPDPRSPIRTTASPRAA
jgi:hypothetical protein